MKKDQIEAKIKDGTWDPVGFFPLSDEIEGWDCFPASGSIGS